jgi:hypothetical protein
VDFFDTATAPEGKILTTAQNTTSGNDSKDIFGTLIASQFNAIARAVTRRCPYGLSQMQGLDGDGAVFGLFPDL